MSAREKLNKGRNLLNKANNDPDLLGLALTSIHGALEDSCRDRLASPQIKQQHGIDVQNRAEASWQTLLELMGKYGGWSQQDVRYVAKMNALRNKVAHGEDFNNTHQDLAEYLAYVEQAIARDGNFATSETSTASNSSTTLYFPQNLTEGGKVTPFRFYIERSDAARS
jgi:ABC-type Fe2+-enterobactin transport system substrate-binding protein